MHVPAGTARAYQVDPETARLLNITTPGTSASSAQAPPDMDTVMAATNEHGVEILDSPPGARAG